MIQVNLCVHTYTNPPCYIVHAPCYINFPFSPNYHQVLDLFPHHQPSVAVEVSSPQWFWAAGSPHHPQYCWLEKWTLASGSAPYYPHSYHSAWARNGLHTAVSVTGQRLSCSLWATGACQSWSPLPPSWLPEANTTDHCFSTWFWGTDTCGSSWAQFELAMWQDRSPWSSTS